MGGRVIADIGGTSARWVLLRPDGTADPEQRTAGLNLAAGDAGEALEQLRGMIRTDAGLASATEVHAYAAGAGSPMRARALEAALGACWPGATVHVGSDLLGAARALYGNAGGAVLILGTGMNAGHCQDGRITHGIVSLGYILGDEGSGADLGRHLLTAMLRGQLPPDLAAQLFPEGIDMDRVVRNLYRGTAPQAWLAALARPLADHRAHPIVQRLLRDRSGALADVLVQELPGSQQGEVRAIGSIANAFSEELRQAFLLRGLRLSEVRPEAMPGLLRYHREVVQ